MSHSEEDQNLVKRIGEMYTLEDFNYYTGNDQEFDILIGNDYYTQVMLGEKVKILDGLFLLNSVFGYILSGKVTIYSNNNYLQSDSSLFNKLTRTHKIYVVLGILIQ